MGMFVEGVWQNDEKQRNDQGGSFQRPATKFRNFITPDGGPGASGEGGFPAEAGRYHLYVSLACPWAHRTLIFRKLKKLEDIISVSLVSPDMGKLGWTFDKASGSSGDHLFGAEKLADIYLEADSKFSGRVTVPVLWDKQRNTIVNNESAEIIRMLNSAFSAFTGNRTDYYPAPLHGEIDRINARIYSTLNNGVYRAGFATTQQAYEQAFGALFETLDWIEEILLSQRYLAGRQLTEADWRLFTTLIRFDAVYYGHFKCNLRRVIDYPNLSNYVRELYQVPGVAETVDIAQIKRHYYGSHRNVNPTGIIPVGPALDFNALHDRSKFN